MGFQSFQVDPSLDSGFRLQGDSPCIDAGRLIKEFTIDLGGDLRPQDGFDGIRGDGSDYDIGAFEYPGLPIEEPRETYTPISTPTLSPTPTLGPTLTPAPPYHGEDLYVVDLPNDVTMEFVRIPPGSFIMGADPYDVGWTDEDELPQHQVTIDYSFYMGKHEVTQSQWLAVMGQWLTEEPDYVGDNHPAQYISWNDSQIFIKTLNSLGPLKFRLPGEAEWEYGCRAGTTTRFSFGPSDCIPGNSRYGSGCNLEYYDGNIPSSDIGGKLPNGWGLYGMHGGMEEWCQDRWHPDYVGAPTDGSAWESGDSPYRCIRQKWAGAGNASNYRSASRSWGNPDGTTFYSGFRLVLEVDSISEPPPPGVWVLDGSGQVRYLSGPTPTPAR